MPETPASTSAQPPRWRDTFAAYTEPAALRMLLLGFSAGLPFVLVGSTLGRRLREAGVDLGTIGFLTWIAMAYSFKWAWAPLVDRLPLPFLHRRLGRRRSWMLLAQSMVLLGLLGMALSDPRMGLLPLVCCALVVALSSATQDIALDAFRIESAGHERQGMLAATYQTGYRMAMLWAGAGVLWFAARFETPGSGYQQGAWMLAYAVSALSMLPGMLTVLWSPEPAQAPTLSGPAPSLRQILEESLVAPFADFLQRYRWQGALILAMIGVYRISDVVMGAMATPFYADMGFSKDEVAAITKLFGLWLTLIGAFVSGILVMRWGVMRVLMLGAALSAASNLLFAWLAGRGHDLQALLWVISADNFASGMASAAFVAYLSKLTNIQYSATQYALFSSLMLLVPTWLAGFSGLYVQQFGYSHFFIATALLGLPVLLLVALAQRHTPAQ